MSPPLRLDVITVLIAAIAVTWVCGLKIDFSRLSVHSGARSQLQKRSSCQGNPCEPSRPFLCQSYQRCIRLVDICDGKWDCEDGFDEDPAVCYSVSRPPEDALWEFLERQSRWMIPNLFNGADPQMVAHQLTVARSLSDLQERLGLTDKNVDNIQRAFLGAIEGDERPLLRLGMPDGAWPEVKYLLEALYNSGLDV